MATVTGTLRATPLWPIVGLLAAFVLATGVGYAGYSRYAASTAPAHLVKAERAVDDAAASLNAAQAKFADLTAGPTAQDAQQAQATVDSANSSVQSAQAKLDALKAPPSAADLAAAQQNVQNA